MKRYGYRTESFSGSGERKLAEIVSYEMSELQNTDIPKYVLAHYKLSDKLRTDLDATLALEDIGEYPFLIDRKSFNGLVEKMIDEIRKKTGKDIRYGLWLTAKDSVAQYNLHDGTVDAYETSDIIISDLGPEGKLYAYEQMPTPVNNTDPSCKITDTTSAFTPSARLKKSSTAPTCLSASPKKRQRKNT